MKKRIWIILIAVILLGVAYGVREFQRGIDSTADTAADFTMTSSALLQEFLDDQEAAKTKYQGKVVSVTGPIFKINNENGKVVGVQLGDDELNTVNFTIQEPSESTEMASDQLTVKGVFSGVNYDAESMLPAITVEFNYASIVQ